MTYDTVKLDQLSMSGSVKKVKTFDQLKQNSGPASHHTPT